MKKNIWTNNYKYQKPKDSIVSVKLAEWQKRKFGLMMHWGPYTQWDIMESWPLCSDPYASWNIRYGPYADDYDAYKTAYENLQHTFYPNLFYPDNFAIAAKNAGMKYLIFTVKHLDGFCMYTSQLTNYNISDTSCPFHSDPRNNISNVLFNSFRSREFFIGMYYSKADWHSRDFWWKAYATPGIRVNYPIYKNTQKWNNYVQYIQNQIIELMTTLGRIDILWLDASWINPSDSSQNINMNQIAANSRMLQPGIILVNRRLGEYEDYLTPEQEMPEEPINYPWELCMPMGIFWSNVSFDTINYKSTDSLIHTLAEVASKGGNLLLNVSPDKFGGWPYKAYYQLNEIGNWMNISGSAIYETSYTTPFKENNIYFTKKADTVYALYLKYDNQTTMPSQISFTGHLPRQNSNIYLLGYPFPLNYSVLSNKVYINIPPEIQNNPPCRHAWVFKLVKGNSINININNSKIPEKFKLYQNYPNPFNPETTIIFDLPSVHNSKKNIVKLKIFNSQGKEIEMLVNHYLSPGSYSLNFSGKNLPSGVYFLDFKVGDYSETRKIILVK